MQPQPILFSPEGAAQLLGVSRSTIYKLAQQGLLRGVRVGRARRFSRQELESLVERLEAASPDTDYPR
jgi:excisionase family DNA binding protein